MVKICWAIFCSMFIFSAFPAVAEEDAKQQSFKIYQKKCTFCHQAKSIQSLPNMKAWTHLLYTSACPQVSIKLSDKERQLIKKYLEQTFKESSKNTSGQSSDRPDN